MKCTQLNCSQLFSGESLLRSFEQNLASHSDVLNWVCALCAGFWKFFSLKFSRLLWFLVSFSNGDEKSNLLGWLELELLWDSVSKDLGFIFIFLFLYSLIEIKLSYSAVKNYFHSLFFLLGWRCEAFSGLIPLYISHQQYQKYQCYFL